MKTSTPAQPAAKPSATPAPAAAPAPSQVQAPVPANLNPVLDSRQLPAQQIIAEQRHAIRGPEPVTPHPSTPMRDDKVSMDKEPDAEHVEQFEAPPSQRGGNALRENRPAAKPAEGDGGEAEEKPAAKHR